MLKYHEGEIASAPLIILTVSIAVIKGQPRFKMNNCKKIK